MVCDRLSRCLFFSTLCVNNPKLTILNCQVKSIAYRKWSDFFIPFFMQNESSIEKIAFICYVFFSRLIHSDSSNRRQKGINFISNSTATAEKIIQNHIVNLLRLLFGIFPWIKGIITNKLEYSLQRSISYGIWRKVNPMLVTDTMQTKWFFSHFSFWFRYFLVSFL